MTFTPNDSDATGVIKPKSDFQVLIAYPSLPLMLAPGVATGLFARIFNFLNEHQDMAKTFFGEDAQNVAVDRRADYRVSPEPVTMVALDELMSPMVGH